MNTVTAGAQTFPSIAMDEDGDFVITWSSLSQDGSGYGVYGQRFNAAGAPRGEEFQVNVTTAGNQNFSAVATDADGDFVVTWTGSDQDGDRTGIFARRYDASDSPKWRVSGQYHRIRKPEILLGGHERGGRLRCHLDESARRQRRR